MASTVKYQPVLDARKTKHFFVRELRHNAALNRQTGAALALCDNGAERNDRTKQAPRRTVRVEVPC